MGKAQDHARAQLDAVHDATGKRRNSSRGKLVILFFVIVIGSLAGYAVYLVTTGQVPWQNPVAATTDTGLKYEILKPGHGDPAVTGQTVTLHYKGSLLADGSVFDDSFARGQPITIKLGVDRMIAGFTQGVIGMKVGELRRLTIPPNLAYGNRAQPNIPANATLVFEVELLSID
ncbi:MAG: FKBP-type peptidyl-prolyl cis-trans isomerase [Phycisphaera sp.]|nr:FKBP-type peptidyl-prolyl cis-trans isomerase [Phycisphaera sp.]